MLQQISWFTYAASVASLGILYYSFVGVTYYRAECLAIIRKFTGHPSVTTAAGNGDLHLPVADIMGKAQPADIDFVCQEELSFGPVNEPDGPLTIETNGQAANSRLISNFSEMISEVKTLIRVINESAESKENFEMLFRLIIQKYPAVAGTPYAQQIDEYLLAEGAPEFPFSLTKEDLINYWTEKDQDQQL